MPRPTLRIRRYIAGDAALIRPRVGMAAEASVATVPQKLLLDFLPDGDAWTVTADGAPIAVCGLQPIWPGRTLAWSWIGRDVCMRGWAYMSEAVREVIGARLALAKEAGRALRIEATSSFPAGCDWLHKLGFEAEGVLKAYGPAGEDHVLYSRTVTRG